MHIHNIKYFRFDKALKYSTPTIHNGLETTEEGSPRKSVLCSKLSTHSLYFSEKKFLYVYRLRAILCVFLRKKFLYLYRLRAVLSMLVLNCFWKVSLSSVTSGESDCVYLNEEKLAVSMWIRM